MNKRLIGAEGETAAVRYLEEHGYQIIKRNYRNRYGEIDIIAELGNVLVFVEVKYRRAGDYGDPLEAVDIRKQRRISKAALYYYSGYGHGWNRPCRFDVVAIYGDGTIRHVENAFEFQG